MQGTIHASYSLEIERLPKTGNQDVSHRQTKYSRRSKVAIQHYRQTKRGLHNKCLEGNRLSREINCGKELVLGVNVSFRFRRRHFYSKIFLDRRLRGIQISWTSYRST